MYQKCCEPDPSPKYKTWFFWGASIFQMYFLFEENPGEHWKFLNLSDRKTCRIWAQYLHMANLTEVCSEKSLLKVLTWAKWYKNQVSANSSDSKSGASNNICTFHIPFYCTCQRFKIYALVEQKVPSILFTAFYFTLYNVDFVIIISTECFQIHLWRL